VKPEPYAYNACLTPVTEPSNVDADAVSVPLVSQEHPADETKENIYEQLLQICTEMSVKRYATVECSQPDTIKQEVKAEEGVKNQDTNVTHEIPVEAENDGIDTADLAQKIQQELRRFEISQTVFARHILNRSQGTLSDLLKRPQPWAALGSGRHTYQRMADWLQLPDEQKSLLKGNDNAGKSCLEISEKYVLFYHLIPGRDLESPKTVRKHKTVFTHLQKNTLHAVYKVSSF
jgi:CUT domain